MRQALCNSLMKLADHNPYVFLTGDLGFMALEPLEKKLSERFLNVGISEQNMVSLAAGIASEKLPCWIYSIAPFVYARPFEQIRNDISLHQLDVKIIGNGGGYGYGVMGATHHALEDYGILLTLSGLQAFIPAFATDVDPTVEKMAALTTPSYLRLGRCEAPRSIQIPKYQPWRKVLDGKNGIFLVAGALAGKLWTDLLKVSEELRPELWVLCELPISNLNSPPKEFLSSLKNKKRLLVVEEHVKQGGLGQMMSHWLLTNQINVEFFEHAYAVGYPSQRYGSQQFHRQDSGLDIKSLLLKLGDQLD
jgi:transketolase